MSALERFRGWLLPREEERSDPPLSFADWANLFQSFNFQGINYTLPGSTQEDIGSGFTSTSRLAYKSAGVVFACMDVRLKLFSEARFMYRRTRSGRPGDLFSFKDDDLGVLRVPWAGGTTGDLLARMIQHADLAGNAFVARRAGQLVMLRPDWVSILAGSRREDSTVWDVDAEVLGYTYQEGGPGSGKEPVFFDASEVAHFAPIPDPEARFRGMSWLTPIVREVMSDKAATDHKLKYFENAATPQLSVKIDTDDLDVYQNWIRAFKRDHDGADNAYKTLFLAAGADATVIGSDLKQIDFKVTQGAGETRIAAAAGVPPVIVGLSEGLAAATYSNYGQARRRFADGTMRPLWRNACASLAAIVQVPSDAELWYDDRDIKALQEDQQDAANILATKAQTIKALVDSGYESDSVVAAVSADDLSLLKHTGLFSVQLQPPGSMAPDPADAGDVPDPMPAAAGANGARADREWFEIVEALTRQVQQRPPDVNVTVPVPAPVLELGERSIVVEAAPAPDVHVAAPVVTVEAAQVTVPAPEVNVTVDRSGNRRRVDFGDGRGATVTEGDAMKIEFDDGRTAVVTEVDE